MPTGAVKAVLFGNATWAFAGSTLDVDFANKRAAITNRQSIQFNDAFTFTRATVGYAQSVAGAWYLFASGVPRITDQGYLSETAATNLCLRSRDFNNASWVKTTMTTLAPNQIGIDGIASTASLITASGANALALQTITQAATSSTFSVFIKRSAGVGTIGICQDGVTFTDVTALINSTTFTRVSLTASQLNPVIGIRLGTNTDAVIVDIAQFEATGFMTSPIVTTSASVARNADVMTGSAALNSLVTTIGYPYTMFGQVTGVATTAAARMVQQIDDGTATMVARHVISSTEKWAALAINTSNLGNPTSSGSITTGLNKGAIVIAQADYAAVLNGGTVATANTAGVMPTVNTIRFGNTVSTSQLNGYLQRATIWAGQRLPNAQLQAMST